MAKTKADYIAFGAVDAKAGTDVNKPKSGWQLQAYTEGWQEQHDEMAAQEASKVAYKARVSAPLFKAGAMKEAAFVQRRVRDTIRRHEATVANLSRRAEQRKLRNETANLGNPRGDYVSPNIKRSSSNW